MIWQISLPLYQKLKEGKHIVASPFKSSFVSVMHDEHLCAHHAGSIINIIGGTRSGSILSDVARTGGVR